MCQPILDLGPRNGFSSKTAAAISLSDFGWGRTVNGGAHRGDCGAVPSAPRRHLLERAAAKLFTVRTKWEMSELKNILE